MPTAVDSSPVWLLLYHILKFFERLLIPMWSYAADSMWSRSVTLSRFIWSNINPFAERRRARPVFIDLARESCVKIRRRHPKTLLGPMHENTSMKRNTTKPSNAIHPHRQSPYYIMRGKLQITPIQFSKGERESYGQAWDQVKDLRHTQIAIVLDSRFVSLILGRT
jgi:hypothetical protein